MEKNKNYMKNLKRKSFKPVNVLKFFWKLSKVVSLRIGELKKYSNLRFIQELTKINRVKEFAKISTISAFSQDFEQLIHWTYWEIEEFYEWMNYRPKRMWKSLREGRALRLLKMLLYPEWVTLSQLSNE